MELDALAVFRTHWVIEAALCAVILLLGILTWVVVRVRNHHGKGVKWLYAAFALYFLAYLFGAVDYGYFIEHPQLAPLTYSNEASIRYFETQERIGEIALFFRTVGDCALVSCIAGLAAGIYALSSPKRAHVYYALIVAIAYVIAILALIVFSCEQWLTTEDVKDYRRIEKSMKEYYGERRARQAIMSLLPACEIMLLVWSVVTTGWVVVAINQARKTAGNSRMLPSSARVLVAAALVNVAIHGWAMRTTAIRFLTGVVVNPLWFYVVDLIINRFGTVVVLGLLSNIATKKPSDSWSTLQADTAAGDDVQQMYVSKPYQPHE